MAITCIKLEAETNCDPKAPQPLADIKLCSAAGENLSRTSDDEAFKMDDYGDILNLTRVLEYGPKSKADVDSIINRYILF